MCVCSGNPRHRVPGILLHPARYLLSGKPTSSCKDKTGDFVTDLISAFFPWYLHNSSKEPIQLEQRALSLEQAKLKLASAQRDLDAMLMVASVDGTVTELNLKIGQMASSGQTAIVLSDLATLVVEIGLDETDIAQVQPQQEAIITLDAFDGVVLNGVITKIAPMARVQSGVVLYDVTVALAPTDLPVKAGMTADVEIVTSSADDALVVPIKAIRSVGEGSLVLRQLYPGEDAPEMAFGGAHPAGGLGQGTGAMTPGNLSPEELSTLREEIASNFQQLNVAGFVPVPVILGMMTDSYVEIVSGLSDGDVVLLSASAVTSDGQIGPPGGVFMMGGRP
ncbi:MAG: HlyD family efflux transporter periplasmic adaptor subunit [Anaerolineales bacterium]|nr:MAG: HlyD family efflux transporter periplasmic adaptor subunit [Anaerolineales bacterium]